jgi:hypothetical protein
MWKDTKDFINAAIRSTRQSSEHQLSFSKAGETTEVAEKKEEMSMNFRLFCFHLSFFFFFFYLPFFLLFSNK